MAAVDWFVRNSRASSLAAKNTVRRRSVRCWRARLSKQIAKGMIAVRTGPEILVTIVGSAKYFRRHSLPSNSDQLAEHRCIELRYPASGTLNAWQLVNRLKSSRVKRAGGPPRRPSRFWSTLYDIGRPTTGAGTTSASWQHTDRTGWLGRLDSNQGMAESKSAALPLGYAPTRPARFV
jgi:hypothetical protein